MIGIIAVGIAFAVSCFASTLTGFACHKCDTVERERELNQNGNRNPARQNMDEDEEENMDEEGVENITYG